MGVLLPGTDFAVDHPRPYDPRPMLDCGMTVALATNCCPGCWMESMQEVMIFATRLHRMTPAEAFRAATCGAAEALTLEDRGVIAAGKMADLLVMDLARYEEAVYQYGVNHVETVIKGGVIVAHGGQLIQESN